MSESLTSRKPRKRSRRPQVERPVLRLPVPEAFDRRQDEVETKPGDSVAAPERGVAVIDFFI
jgi:hypothetical protein